MSVPEQIASVIKLLDQATKAGDVAYKKGGRERSVLTKEEQLAVDTANFGILMMGMTVQVLKLAAAAGDVTLGLGIGTAVMGVAVKAGSYALETTRGRKVLTAKDVLLERQDNMPLAIEAFSSDAFSGQEALLPLIVGPPPSDLGMPQVKLTGPKGLQNIGLSLETLSPSDQQILINTFTNACMKYKESPSLRPAPSSTELVTALVSHENNRTKLNAITKYLAEGNFERNSSGKLTSNLASTIEDALDKDPEITGSTGRFFRASLDVCYSQSYGLIHDSFLVKEDNAPYKRGEAIKFINKNISDIKKIEQALADLPPDLKDFNIDTNELPSMAKVAALMGLLDPTKHQVEIDACKKYLSLMQSFVSAKVLEEKPGSEPEVRESVHNFLQNVTDASMSNRHKRLEDKDENVKKVSYGLKGTGTALSGAAMATVAFPPASAALAVTSAVTSLAGSGVNLIKFGVAEADLRKTTEIPKSLTMDDTQNRLNDLRNIMGGQLEKSQSLRFIAYRLSQSRLKMDPKLTTLKESIEVFSKTAAEYRDFVEKASDKLEALQNEYQEFSEYCTESEETPHFGKVWEELSEINAKMDTIEQELQTKSMEMVTCYESTKKEAQELRDNPELSADHDSPRVR